MTQRNNYDSGFCGSLPIHLINVIQPYGVLMVLDRSELKVLQVSENIKEFTGLAADQVAGRQINEFVSEDQLQALLRKFELQADSKVPMRMTFRIDEKPVQFLALVHAKDNFLVLELEDNSRHGDEALFISVYQEVKYAMAEISHASSTLDVCNVAIRELKRLSGFDKIMVYKFDEDWNGEVIAEVKEDGMDEYLGLRFPASDIPKQARELYFKNPYRLIPTRDYQPVKIYPVINPLTNGFVDLSNCNLRSVPAVHLEYLKNMRVVASMSTAIIKDEKLWGLISCHHRAEKYLNYEMCSVFELMAGIISAKVTALQNREQMETAASQQQVFARLLEQVYLEDDPVAGIMNFETTVLDLLKCDGAAITYNKKVATIGKVPDRHEIKDLVLWLQTSDVEKVYTTTSLADAFENALSYADVASGIIVLPIHRERGEYLVGFRQEVVSNVNWGGNPNEAINFEKNNIAYHPRNSFNLWQQTVQHTSLPWTKDEVAVADAFRNFLIEYTLKKVYSLM